jgi:uroporphyrinogen III methyltransferase/synthase
MKNSRKVLSAGARNSRLSIAQTRQVLEKIESLVPALEFNIVPLSSPGDRDKKLDLRLAAPDFFTKDLDDAILEETIDCAIHSSKDLPEKLREGLDVLYFPWREDPRDVIVYPEDKGLVSNPRIGVSSERRELYALKRFPDGRAMPIRGNIEERISQLDEGKYDVLIMAAAGLIRLGIDKRISEFIPLEEMTPPPGQGQLAMVFKKGNPAFTLLRKLFVKTVVFAGAGVGTKENTTLGTIEALENCDACFYDALCPQDLLDYLPPNAEKIYVGKRKGKHSYSQSDICDMLIDYSIKGKKTVRLKGGDPGMYGRLAEEITALDQFELPYRVLPGVSSLTAATTSTGLLLTRRGIARGFTVSTPCKSGSSDIEWFSLEEKKLFPQVFFMGISELEKITANLLADGYPPELPAAVVLNAGYPDCEIINGTINDIKNQLPKTSKPGIIIVGENADKQFLFHGNGLLNGMRILFTGSENLCSKAIMEIHSLGGIPICMPMIKLEKIIEINEQIRSADWLIVNSPSCAKLLIDSKLDLRRLPKIAVCGIETAAVFNKNNIFPEICPEDNFGTEGLYKTLIKEIKSSDKIIRLCSSSSNSTLTQKLKETAPCTEDIIFYRNIPVSYDSFPAYDAIMFTSPSTVEAFPVSELKNKKICAIGTPTEKKLKELVPEQNIIKGLEANIADMVFALAVDSVINKLNSHDGGKNNGIS